MPVSPTWSLAEVKRRCDIQGDCWIWKQSVNNYGYPQVSIDGKIVSVRKLVAQYAHGYAAPEMLVSASCEKRRCCSPKHVRWGTRSDVSKAVHAAKRETNAVTVKVKPVPQFNFTNKNKNKSKSNFITSSVFALAEVQKEK